MRVYLDASVIIAAILSPTGGSAKVIEITKTGKIHAVASQTVIDEVEKHADKIKKTKQEIRSFIATNKIIIRKKISVEEIKPYEGRVDIQDARLISGSLSTHCQYLVTPDKHHLLRPDIKKQFKPLIILNPKEFLETHFSLAEIEDQKNLPKIMKELAQTRKTLI